MQPGTNRTDRASACVGRFFVAHLFQLAQDHRFPELRWQSENGFPHLLDAFLLLRDHHWRQRILRLVPRTSIGIHHGQRHLPRSLLQIFHHTVTGHAKEKSAQLSALWLIFVRLADQQQKDFLHHFFRRPGRTRHPQGVPIERRLVPLVQREEGLLVSAHRTLEQRVLLLIHVFHYSD